MTPTDPGSAHLACEHDELQLTKAILDELPSMVCSFLPGGTIRYVNQAYCDYFGKEREELIGKTFIDLIPEAQQQLVIDNINTLCQEHPELEHEHQVVAPDGTLRWHHWLNRAIFDDSGELIAYQAIGQDVTKRHKVQHDYRLLFDEMTLGYALHEIICDGEGQPVDYRFLLINPAFEQITGLKAADVEGQTVLQVLPATEKFWIDTYGQVALRGTPVTIENYSRELGKYFSVKAFQPAPGQFATLITDISDQRQMTKALAKSEERFSLAMAFANDGLFDWDLQSNKIYYSPGWKRLLGYEDDELANEFSVWEQLTDPAQVDESWTMLREVLDGSRKAFVKEFRMRHKKGHWVDILSRANVVRDGQGEALRVVGTHVDISERKAVEQALLKEKNKAERYLNLAGVLFVGLDRQGRVNVVNDKACEVLQVSREQILGQDWFANHIPASEQQQVRAVFDQLMTGDVEPVEYFENSVLTSTGEERVLAWHNTIIVDEGRISGILGSGEDITVRKQLERQVLQSQKMEAIGTLAGGIAHDFNNILAAIMGYCELALESLPEKNPVRHDIDEVLGAGRRATELVKQILTFSRQAEESLADVDLAPVLKEAIKLMRATLPASIGLEVHVPDDLPIVQADPTQVHQVLMNLCTNAKHALPDQNGEIIIRIGDRQVAQQGDVELCPQLAAGHYVEIQVSDNGCGMDVDLQSRIYEPFFSTREVGLGTGLGLAVVHGIVSRHQGEIGLVSGPGQGSSFHVFFPVSTGGLDTPGPEEQRLPKGREHIVVVDDDRQLAAMLAKMLERLGYRVDACHTGQQVLAMLAEESQEMDLLITDMTMPEMTGAQLAEQVLARRPQLPIILCTGFSELINEELAKKAGMAAYLMKPVSREKLAQTVRQVLDRG